MNISQYSHSTGNVPRRHCKQNRQCTHKHTLAHHMEYGYASSQPICISDQAQQINGTTTMSLVSANFSSLLRSHTQPLL